MVFMERQTVLVTSSSREACREHGTDQNEYLCSWQPGATRDLDAFPRGMLCADA